MTPCNICGTESHAFGKARVLRKYDAAFFRCPRCGYIHTPEPFWLEEAYALDQSTDVGMVSRNVMCARIAKAVLGVFFDGRGRFLDFGGGPGLFVRLMRDNGFDFYWQDAFSKNLFAGGFAGNMNSKYEAITVFEVFEHLTGPVASVAEMFNVLESILFSTAIVPAVDCQLGRWWYYAPDQGQHVSFYTFESLRILSSAFGARLYTDGNSFHLMTRRRIAPLGFLFSLLSKPRLAALVDIGWRRQSLTMDDYARALGDLGR